MSDVSGGEVAGWIGGGVAVLGAFGAAVKWMVTWLAGRNDKLLAELREDTKAMRDKVESIEAKLNFLGAEMALLLAEVPNADARQRAREALRKVFPVEPAMPREFAEILARMDRGTP